MATMATRESEGNPTEVESMSIDSARDVLGDLVARADYAGTPTVITRYGKDAAVVVSMRDFNRLRQLTAPSEAAPRVGQSVEDAVEDVGDVLGRHGV